MTVLPRATGHRDDTPAGWFERFERACTRHASATALEIGDQRWRYADLHDQRRQAQRPVVQIGVAPALVADLQGCGARVAALVGQHRRGGRPRVGLIASRSLTATAGGLAVLAAGCTLVPLHPAQPPARLLAAMRHAGVSVLILGDEALPLLERLWREAEDVQAVIAPESTVEGAEEHQARGVLHDRSTMGRPAPWLLPPEPQGGDIECLHAVSHGSGDPRAIALDHLNLATSWTRFDEVAAVRPDDRIACVGEGGPELQLREPLQAWCSGASLVLLPESATPSSLVESRVGVLRLGSAVASHWARQGQLKAGSLPGLRQVLWSGEPLPSAAALAWAAAAPRADLIQAWGSAETGGGLCVYRWQRGRSERACLRGLVPLGEPLSGHRAALIDGHGQTLPGIASGELCLQGAQISAGDWPRTAEAQESVVELPAEDGAWHRTGVLVERDTLGVLHLVRRLDTRLFTRGQRVESAELEAALRAAATSDQVAVIAQPSWGGQGQGLVAFIGSTEPPAQVAQRIRDRIAERLPRFWLPDEIRVLRQLPMDGSQRIDRAALAALLVPGTPAARPRAARAARAAHHEIAA